MFRSYICDNELCNVSFEVEQDRDDDILKICPCCDNSTLYQDLSGIYIGIKGDLNTVGQIMDHNTKKLGRYGLEAKEKEERDRQRRIHNHKKAQIENAIPNARVPDFDKKDVIPETPSYVKKAIDAQSTPEEKAERQKKYIFEGK